MKIDWRSSMLGILPAMALACAHAPAPANGEAGVKSEAYEKVVVTGSRIPQRVDRSSGRLRSTSPIRIYSREELDRTGRQYDLRAALGDLDPSFSR
jgi:hypothetical protein